VTKPIAFISGSSGFIGKYLVKHLEDNGYEVRGFDLKCGQDIRTDLASLDLAMKDATYCFHLAGLADIVPSIANPVEYMSTNVMGTINVLEAARKAGVKKFVYAASSSCYGKCPNLPTSESSQLKTEYPYALSKLMGERTAMHWDAVYDIPVVSLRLFNVYGRGQYKSCYGSVFSTFMAQRANGKPLTIVGNGTQTRDFVHVSDVCAAFILAAESVRSAIPGYAYNVGAEIGVSVNYLAGLIGGERIYIPSRPGEPKEIYADCTKIKMALGWKPKIKFEDGVAEMLEHLDEWKNQTVWTPEAIAEETKPWMEALS